MVINSERTVFFVSESTGITAETLGHSLLSQFPHLEFTYLQRPFIDTEEKALHLANEISLVNNEQGFKPIVFATMPEQNINEILSNADCHYYEVFENYLVKIGQDLHATPKRESGLSHGLVNEKIYDARIDALNFTLKHDDAMVLKTIGNADVIIVGVSRSGKTPTSLYLALKFGIKAANYPITDDDFEHNKLPQILLDNRDKLFATSIKAKRLQQIREKRRPNSQYSSIQTCKAEIKKAKNLYEKYDLHPMDVTAQSIEELATQIVRKLKDNSSSIQFNHSKDI
ncbi:MAG: pyruvate, phosphate dikinase/phosphoenolpyruvate synthase regulator [Cocleimonas sp.]